MYGKDVMSEREIREQQAIHAAAANVYGPDVVGVTAAQAAQAAFDAHQAELRTATAAEPAVPQTSVADLEAALAANPASFAALLASELARAEGPRIDALVALRIAADAPESGASAEQIASLDTLTA